MNGKKGVEQQFNWIFILVAGSIILILFASIIVKQKQISDVSSSSDALSKIQLMLSGTKSTVQSRSADIAGISLKYDCNNLRMGPVSSALTDPVFAPDTIKGAKLQLFSREWAVPFRVTNFLYMTTEQSTYIFVYVDTAGSTANKDLTTELFASLPSGITKRMSDTVGSLPDSGNVKIVFVTSDATSLSLVTQANAKVIAIVPTSGLEKGTIYWIKTIPASTSPTSSTYLTQASLLGAVFADSGKNYDCAMGKAYARLASLAGLYQRRLAAITGTACNGPPLSIYAQASEKLGLIETAAGDPTSRDQIFGHAATLIQKNVDASLAGCPSIY